MIIIDTTEVEIEQPKKWLRIPFRKAKVSYSKSTDNAAYQDCNICVAVSSGRRHDFAVFLLKLPTCCVESGYKKLLPVKC